MKVIKYREFNTLKNIKNAVCLSVYAATYYPKIYIYYIKNGKLHNDKFYAGYLFDSFRCSKNYYYFLYGKEFYYVNSKTWKKKVKQLKQEEKLGIFK